MTLIEAQAAAVEARHGGALADVVAAEHRVTDIYEASELW